MKQSGLFVGLVLTGLAASQPHVKTVRDLEYARPAGKPLLLDLYLPAQAKEPVPVVVAIHGGAFRSGSKESATGSFLATRGFALANVNYRLSGEAQFPAQLYDVKAVVRWLRAHSAEYGLDPRHMGVIGTSAGGLLAGLLGTTGKDKSLEGDLGHAEQSSEVQAVVDGWGPSDLLTLESDAEADPNVRPAIIHNRAGSPEAALLGAPVSAIPDQARRASPITYVSPAGPPFLLLHGDHDPLIPARQSYRLFHEMKKAGIDVTLYIGVGFAHGFRTAEMEAMVTAFFQRTLQPRE